MRTSVLRIELAIDSDENAIWRVLKRDRNKSARVKRDKWRTVSFGVSKTTTQASIAAARALSNIRADVIVAREESRARHKRSMEKEVK